MDAIVYAGGRLGPSGEAGVSVFDHGLLYGDGVFEGIRAYDGRVFKLERHVERLFDSAKAIRLEIPASRDEVAELVLEACRRNTIVDGYIRLVVTRGAGDLGIDPRSCPRPDITVIAKRVAALDLAADLTIRTEERQFTLFDVWTAREAFLCGTMAEIVPIATVDGRTIGTSNGPGPMTSRIATAYHRLVRSTGTPIHRAAAV